MQVKFSGLVVTYNDEHHLVPCLNSLKFCEEIVVVDLGSSDRSREIARQYGAKVIKHHYVNIIEEVKSFALERVNNDWVVFIDPDESFPAEKLKLVAGLIDKEKDLGAVSVKIVNYFQGDRIEYGRWRPYLHNNRIINRKAVILNETVHGGVKFKSGFKTISKPDFLIKHDWVESLEDFYEKHLRYLQFEGERRYNLGIRFSRSKMYLSQINNLIKFFIIQKGYKDHIHGYELLGLALWYDRMGWIALKKFEQKND